MSVATRRNADCSSDRRADTTAARRDRAASSATTTAVTRNTPSATTLRVSPIQTEPCGGGRKTVKTAILSREVSAASRAPHTTATGRTASKYRTSRLNTGTCRSSRRMTPVKAATSTTLASSPLDQRTRDGLSRLPVISLRLHEHGNGTSRGCGTPTSRPNDKTGLKVAVWLVVRGRHRLVD